MSDFKGLRPTTLVLIHGAWAGSWIWQTLTPLLAEENIKVIAPDMPGTPVNPDARLSLEGCVDEVLACCAGLEGPLFLLGHSGGGVIATQAAETLGGRASGVIFVAGMMLPSGRGFAELVAELAGQFPEAAGIGPHLHWNADRSVSSVPASAARDIFLQDLPPAQADAAAARLSPQPEATRALIPCWTEEGFGRLPRLYVEALQDRSVILPAQRLMQRRVPGARVVSLDTGHVPQVAAPQALARVILAFMNDYAIHSFQDRNAGIQDPA